MTREEMDRLCEASKLDHTFIAGSQVRDLAGMVRAATARAEVAERERDALLGKKTGRDLLFDAEAWDGAMDALGRMTARAERAEAALRGLLPFVEAPYHMNACEHGYERDSIYEPCPYEKCDDRERADALDAVRTALSPP